MKKGFPNKILGIPYGWKNRGKTKRTFARKEGDSSIYKYTSCSLCSSNAYVGIENEERFTYCPKCLLKLKSLPTND